LLRTGFPWLWAATILFVGAAGARGQTVQFEPLQLEPLPTALGSETPLMARAPLDPGGPVPWSLTPPTPPPQQYMLPPGPASTLPDPIYLDQPPKPKSAGRDGMLQRFTFLNGFLPKIGPQGQNNEDLEVSALLGIPIPSRESPILLKPAFEWHQWWGYHDDLLPGNLYDAYLDVLWLHNWTPELQTILGASPGWHGDWENGKEEALRVQVLAVLNYTVSPEWKYVLGAKYLDRKDVAVLPIVGVVWTPSDDQEWNLVFPQPKISYRFYCDTWTEYFVTVGGEIGGGVFGVELGTGALDVLTTRDYRVYLGYEQKTIGGWTSRVELGYVFGRIIEFQSGLPDLKPADTMLIRFGVIY